VIIFYSYQNKSKFIDTNNATEIDFIFIISPEPVAILTYRSERGLDLGFSGAQK
jgi:hypothetical protein